MKIEWNKVTWYSWVAAVIVFGAAFGMGFWVGTSVQLTKDAKMITSDTTGMPTLGAGTQSQSAGEKPIAIITYSCEAGKQIQATFLNGKVQIMTNDGKDLTLPQTRSADGGRYANSNESFIFWSKGNGAFVMQTVSGVSTTTYANCTQVAAPIQ